jgi:predicted nucleotidyltransferase
VKKLRAQLPVERVILHGSAARADLTESSDLDIVVIGDFHGRWIDRVGLVQDLTPPGLPIEAFCYTPEEFEEGIARGNPFMREVQKFGRDLSGDEPFELRHRGQDREERAKALRLRGLAKQKPQRKHRTVESGRATTQVLKDREA